MQQDDITNKRAWLWSRDCFKSLPLVVMQRNARVCQRQLSYLLIKLDYSVHALLAKAHCAYV